MLSVRQLRSDLVFQHCGATALFKLSEASKNSLRIALMELLPNIRIFGQAGVLILNAHRSLNLNEILTEQERNSLEKVTDEGGLKSFVERFISDELPDKTSDPDFTFKTLGETGLYGDVIEVSRRIVEAVSNLPHQYTSYMRLSPSLAERIDVTELNLKLTDQLSILSEDMLPKRFFDARQSILASEQIGGFAGGQSPPEPGAVSPTTGASYSSLYAAYRSAGAITDDGGSKIVREFHDEIRAMYGIMVASRLLARHSFGRNQDHSGSTYSYQIDVEKNIILSSIDTNPKDLVDASKYDAERTLSEKNGSKPAFTLEQAISLFDPVVKMFGSGDKRLKTACVWMFRAIQSQRSMDTVLESAIVLEVLLGDRATSDRIGLSKLMANRCAYMLGKGANDRAQIVEQFDEFYKVRSEIVHTGRYKLTKSEASIVKNGLTLATRVLVNEVNLDS